MDLNSILKNLKNIKPDTDYASRSRSHILASIQPKIEPKFTFAIFSRRMVFTTLVLLVVIGGAEAWKNFAPVKIAGLDSKSLTAEAEAIDIQIQLSDLTYTEVENNVSTPVTSNSKTQTRKQSLKTGAKATSSQEITIEEALEFLSK